MSIFKRGYTLAEVLITLAIIGTIAAITIPSLQINAQKAQVVPALQKAMNTLENFNNTILYENNARSLLSIYPTTVAYGEGLLSHLSGASKIEQSYTMGGSANSTEDLIIATSDGIIMGFETNISSSIDGLKSITDDGRLFYRVYVDVNGLKGPNTAARDVFAYYVDVRTGEVEPFGRDYDNNPNLRWQNACPNGKDPTPYKLACTAAIMENDWHIRYNY